MEIREGKIYSFQETAARHPQHPASPQERTVISITQRIKCLNDDREERSAIVPPERVLVTCVDDQPSPSVSNIIKRIKTKSQSEVDERTKSQYEVDGSGDGRRGRSVSAGQQTIGEVGHVTGKVFDKQFLSNIFSTLCVLVSYKESS